MHKVIIEMILELQILSSLVWPVSLSKDPAQENSFSKSYLTPLIQKSI